MSGKKRKEIMYPFALDAGGKVVAAVDALAGENYFCITCQHPMFIRAGLINRPHFAHSVELNTCSPETALHLVAKETIRQGIELALDECRPYPFVWHCLDCYGTNQANLAITPRRILVEKSVYGVRPDLLAINEAGHPLVAIEVVVTHAPEASTLAVYRENKLPVVVIGDITWDDIGEMEKGLSHVSVHVENGFCRSPEHPPDCPHCHSHLTPIKIEVWHGYSCYRCLAPIPVLFFSKMLLWDNERGLKELSRIAREKGVPFIFYRNRRGEFHAAHRCPMCHSWQFNLSVYRGRYDNWHPNPDRPVETIYYFWCERCAFWKQREAVNL